MCIVVAEPNFLLVGVSGGLQEGFPARKYLDYRHGMEGEVKASLIGNALVRGYKAYLDVKQEGWREYIPEPGQPLVNPVVIPSGCDEHANIYAIYAVDERQLIHALNTEPRLLSMSPDTGLVDLTAEETDQEVKDLARHHAVVEGKTDMDRAAFLLVTGVYYVDTLIETPVVYTKSDGTEITDYPRGIAAWAGTEDIARFDPEDGGRKYWESIRRAARAVEGVKSMHPGRPEAYDCRVAARYGSGPNTVRMSKTYVACEISFTCLDMDGEGEDSDAEVSSVLPEICRD
ncbi:unnamed protein product [Choristocarpus tenellus]